MSLVENCTHTHTHELYTHTQACMHPHTHAPTHAYNACSYASTHTCMLRHGMGSSDFKGLSGWVNFFTWGGGDINFSLNIIFSIKFTYSVLKLSQMQKQGVAGRGGG